jgi:pilus assembly protein CpaE
MKEEAQRTAMPKGVNNMADTNNMNTNGSSGIIIVTREFETERAVVDALHASDQLAPAGVYHDLAALETRLDRESAHLVLVDVNGDPSHALDTLEPIINRHVHTRFVILTSAMPGDLMLRAMQVGVRHIQLKATIEKELPDAITRLMPSENSRAQLGSAITVLSAGGGCGATTLVVNLAHELQLTTKEPVLLVDLDFHYGAIANYLELEADYGIAEVLDHQASIDASLIRSTAVQHAENLHALISPASINFADHASLSTEKLDAALLACRQAYRFTLIDAPRVTMDHAAALAAASEVTLIVLQPMIKDIRVAKRMLTALMDRGIPMERIKPIINRYRKRRQMITMEDAQSVMGEIPLVRVSNDYTSAVRGINYGKPLAYAAPRSPLRRDVAELAAQMCTTNGDINSGATN